MTVVRKLAAGMAVLAATVLAGVGTAQADGTPARKAAAVTAPTSWSGLYFGAHAGWAWSDFDTRFSSLPVPPNGFDVTHDAAIYGGQIGIQHQFGHLVIGVEAAISSAWQDNHANELGCGIGNNAFSCGARFNDVMTVGPRIGYAAGKWMPYITGGYANARFEEKAVVVGPTTTFWTGSERHSGWYIGAGVDMALAQGWTVGLEYRHYEFDNELYVPFTPFGVPVFGDRNVADVTLDTVALRVSWKLSRPEPAAKPMK